MRRYDREPQGRVNPSTGETYYLHQAVHESRPNERGSDYVDPYAEFGNRAHEYRDEEIAGFERSARRLADEQAARPDYSRPPRELVDLHGPATGSGPFAGFTRKLELLLRPHNAVREIVATLGPMRGDQPDPRETLEMRGAFFLESTGGEEHYSMMKDPPSTSKQIEEESFEVDEGSLEALIQERLRFAVKLNPSSYRFYFA